MVREDGGTASGTSVVVESLWLLDLSQHSSSTLPRTSTVGPT